MESEKTNREKLGSDCEKYSCDYADLVRPVNQKLKEKGYALSDETYSSISGNMRKRCDKRMSLEDCHRAEIAAFSQDTVRYLNSKDHRNAIMSGAGVLLNSLGAAISFDSTIGIDIENDIQSLFKDSAKLK